MKDIKDPRHNARKMAISFIFSWLFMEPNSDDSINLSKELLEESEFDKELFDYIVDGVKTNKDEIDKKIEEAAPDWPLDKISKIDLVILRIAIFEALYSDKVPARVAIDEAVELAKEFGNDTSPKFVNGVLGTVTAKGEKNNG